MIDHCIHFNSQPYIQLKTGEASLPRPPLQVKLIVPIRSLFSEEELFSSILPL